MYSLFTTIFPMFVIIAIITEWCHTTCFFKQKQKNIYLAKYKIDWGSEENLQNARALRPLVEAVRATVRSGAHHFCFFLLR